MKHANVITNGINYEAGAMTLNGVLSAVTGKTLEDRKIERKSMGCECYSSTVETDLKGVLYVER
jgi:predicted double-glycine peptidase